LGYLDIVINDNNYIFEEVPFDSYLDKIDVEFLMEFLEDELDSDDYETLIEEDFEAISKECTRDLSNWL